MKNIKMGFTLIEIIVTITIISIITYWLSSIFSYNNSDKEKAKIYSNSIKINIEDARNNWLLWKWIKNWSNIEFPKKSYIAIKKDWKNIVYYYINSLDNTIINNDILKPEYVWNIKEIKCFTLNESNSSTINNQVDIEFIWNTISFSWCTSPANSKILKIKTSFNGLENTIKINSVTWLIE